MLWEYLGTGSSVTKGLYHLNGNGNDDSWNSANFTVTNATWVSEWLGGGALSSNGSTTTCRSAAQSLPSWNSPYTIAFRVKLNAEIGSWAWSLISLNPDATLQDTTYLLDYQYNWWTRRLNYQHYYNWPETYYQVTHNITLWTSNRYDIVMVYTGTQMRLYINWVLVVSWWWTWVYWFNAAPTYQVWLSVLHSYVLSAPANRANAKADEVIFENRAWTATEVQKYYTYAKWRFTN